MKKALSLSLAAALALSLITGCTADPAPSQSAQPSGTPAPSQEAHGSYTYADTISWDGQYDVVVVGFGGAGSVAASTAADAGADVLLVEKAPEGREGGNTRYCGQLFVYGGEDEEATLEYYKTLAGQHEIPEAMLEVYTKNIAHMYDMVSKLFGIDKSQFVNWTGTALGSMSPEYPEFPGAEHISLNTLHDGYSDGFLWQQMCKLVTDRADQIDVWFESPATHLIQDPATKTILGVQVERGGENLNIKADNGVVLACGGFENNREMLADYLGITKSNPIGSTYNTGDGITMALEVGADLWHMEAYEGISSLGGSCIALPEGVRANLTSTAGMTRGAVILVAGDGNRFLREDEPTRHGHIDLGDAWMNVRRPLNSYIICDDTVYSAVADTIPDNALTVEHASSIAELVGLVGVDPDALTATVERYNGYAADGYDPEFGRSAESMSPITGDSFYAIEVCANILNTQGGPRRNENAEVLDVQGNPIPHLYSAGELGGITAFQYQGGGNIAECIVFGQIAGANAAAEKDALPAYEAAQPVESNIQYTLGAMTDLAASAEAPQVDLGENEYLGVSHNAMGGDLYVKITMDGDKIAAVEVVAQSETVGIGDKAIETVPGAIVEAGSTDVEGVSGATITSNAIKEAVEDALSQVK